MSVEYLLLLGAVIILSISHALIWTSFEKFNSRLETLEVESIYNKRIIDYLKATEEAYEQTIRKGREGKNLTSARIYGVD